MDTYNILIISDISPHFNLLMGKVDTPLFDIDHTESIINKIEHIKNNYYSILVFYHQGNTKRIDSLIKDINRTDHIPTIIASEVECVHSVFQNVGDCKFLDIVIEPLKNTDLLVHKIKLYARLHQEQINAGKTRCQLEKTLEATSRELKISKKKYSALFNNSSDAKFTTDLNGKILTSNLRASQFLGYTKKEFHGKRFLDFHVVEKKKAIEDTIHKLKNTKKIEFGSILKHRNKGKIIVEISAVSIDLKNDRIIQIVVRDVSEREKTMGHLLIKNRAMDAANDGIIITDPTMPDNPIIYANHNFTKITGYAKSDVLNKNPRFLQSTSSNPDTVKKLKLAIKNKKPFKGEIVNRKKDGSTHWVHLSINPVFNKNGKLINFIGIQNDITKHKEASQELEQYKNFFSVGLDMLCISGMDGYFKKTNHTFTKILGYTEKELLQRPFMDLVHPDDREKTSREASKLASGELTLSFENRYKCKDGQYKYLKWHAIHDVSSNLLYGVARDITEERSAGRALQYSERSLIESQKLAHIGNWEWRRECKKAENWSQEQFRIYGFKINEEITIERFLDRIHPEDRKKVEHQDWQNIPTGEIMKMEFRIIHPKKGIRFIYSLGLPIKNGDGEVYKVIGTDQDITDRKKNEIELKESQQKWTSLFNNSNDIVQVLDREFNIKNINHLPKNALREGLSKSKYIGSNYFDYVQNGNELMGSVTKELSEKRNAHFYHRGLVSSCYFKCNIIPLMTGRTTEGYIVIETDITDEKIQEDKLVESQNRLKRAIETAPIPIMIHDENGKVYRISRGWEKYSGYTMDKIPTLEKWSKLAFGSEQKLSKTYVDNLFFYNETINNGESEIIDNKGGKRIWSFNSTPLGYDGVKRLILSTAIDISKSKKAENEIRRLNKNLELTVEERTHELKDALANIKKTQAQLVQQEKMASLGLLTAGLAHEINNPMNFIYGGINNLERIINDIQPIIRRYNLLGQMKNTKKGLKEIDTLKIKCSFDGKISTIPELVSDIKLGVERTTEVIKGLRTFSRIDTNEKKPYNIHEGLNSSLMLLRNKLTNNIVVKKKYSDKIGEINCFSGQLNQVFLNMINNAIEALEGKGKITIETGMPYGKIVVSIKDNGIGMSKKVKNSIFDPFFTTKEVGKGVGLGLSISYGIIEKHGGEILVISTPKRGTEFRIIIPKN